MVAEPLAFDIPDQCSTTLTAEAISRLLELRHPAPEWATFAELRGGTGFGNRQNPFTAQQLDLFTFNTYPSKGFRSIAYEIKISRADFRRELAKPAKRLYAESVASECFFATPVGLVRTDEVPEGWGLIEVTKGSVRVMKAARQREVAPWPVSFIASMLRCRVDPDQPKTRDSKTMWLHAGREVDQGALLKIAEEFFGRTVESERGLARQAVYVSDDYVRLRDLAAKVRVLTGVWEPTGKDLMTWIAAERERLATPMPGPTDDVMRRLRELHAALGSVLESERCTP